MIAVVLAGVGLPARPFRPVEPIPAGITDMHCHLAGIGAGGSGCFVSPKLRHNWRFKIYLHSFGVSQQELMEQGDRLVADRISASLAQSQYVSKVVLLALDGVVGADGTLDTNRTEVYVPNEFVAEMAARHTNLLFGASVNPYRTDALARLEWAKAHGAVLVKWIPPVMDIDPGDPKLIPFYKKMVELQLPLLSHTGREKSFSHAEEEFGDPEKLRLPLSLGVTVVAAHIASSEKYHGERGPDRLARLMREYPNLYTDISALTQINKPGCLQEALTRPEFSGRLVYGTDYPLINTALVSPWYSFHLSLRQKFQIGRIKNPWDRDVLMKHDLGAPADTFARWNQLPARAGRIWPDNPQRRRRGIFLETPAKTKFKPMGAAYSGDVAPAELDSFLNRKTTMMPALRACRPIPSQVFQPGWGSRSPSPPTGVGERA